MQRSFWNRFATFLVWLLATGCVVYWALKFVRGPQVPLSAAVASPANSAGAVDAQALAKALGGGVAPAVAAASPAVAPSALQAARFVLTGVVVQKAGSGTGVALIAVDGKPSRPYRVGSALTDGVVLHSVSAGKAMLSTAANAPAGLTLELPQLTTAVAGNVVAVRPAMPAPIPAQHPVYPAKGHLAPWPIGSAEPIKRPRGIRLARQLSDALKALGAEPLHRADHTRMRDPNLILLAL
jgi:general secretion pathway protein C